eukprot:354465-Chlamydomonas_euryale.AAC.5
MSDGAHLRRLRDTGHGMPPKGLGIEWVGGNARMTQLHSSASGAWDAAQRSLHLAGCMGLHE